MVTQLVFKSLDFEPLKLGGDWETNANFFHDATMTGAPFTARFPDGRRIRVAVNEVFAIVEVQDD